ncbi:MAG: UDP-N-acetylmuramoyl-tripeptide--D-alanyl-D-alanine ligase [Deltaproteobacteria bacterium]|nr:UDP-N-acetylmuramoyl-tripeptide--D-alanyl-D-alanine ligase [Deltaproteobacteria bacterium]MBW2692321.1 UDP-N-acetylmuramoyl-tripeptide--D-alanyl-D-alanine ligase [Deltaproteobacteria bacterium]
MTLAFRVKDALRWTGGALVAGDVATALSGVSIDSRTVKPGELFFAIVGPSHDGHKFLENALGRGASALIVERGRTLPDVLAVPVITVEDTTRALGSLAAGHRAEFDGPVVAITGSNGKTTTKEMCAAILSVSAPCHRTPGNLNNQYGLPLTLLGRSEADRSLVVELGMNHRGEIAQLVEIAKPTVGVITNVGTAHIEFLGSREEIAREKGDLVEQLPAEGTAVLNADDPLVLAQRDRTSARVISFGTAIDADVRGGDIEWIDDRGYRFELETPVGRGTVEVQGLGPTTVINALAAAAAALAAGASITDITKGLANYQGIKGRLERRELAGGITLVDDTYNANPQSMEASLRLLAELKGTHRAVAILGDMGELGITAEPAHQGLGQLAATLGIDLLIALGARAQTVTAAAVESGMDPAHAVVASDHGDASERACDFLREHDAVLVKGSRSMRMERVVEAIASEKGI